MTIFIVHVVLAFVLTPLLLQQNFYLPFQFGHSIQFYMLLDKIHDTIFRGKKFSGSFIFYETWFNATYFWNKSPVYLWTKCSALEIFVPLPLHLNFLFCLTDLRTEPMSLIMQSLEKPNTTQSLKRKAVFIFGSVKFL